MNKIMNAAKAVEEKQDLILKEIRDLSLKVEHLRRVNG
jgi:hypothetical protein